MTRFFGVALALALIGALGASIGTASAKPGWATSECLIDDGYHSYRPCSSGDGA